MYGSFDIPLIVTVRMYCGTNRSAPFEKLDWLNYTIDNKDSASLPYALSTEIVDPPSEYLMLGNFTLAGLSNGSHTLTILAQSTLENPVLSRSFNSSITFTVDAQMASPSPTSAASLAANLAESASSLYLGNTINFTVTVQGGKEPYAFSWNVDNQTIETSTSPYYSTDTLAVGEHHVNVQVIDAENNTATTLTVAFDVLPNPSSSPALSPSPSVPEFPTWTALPIVATATVLAALFVRRKRQ